MANGPKKKEFSEEAEAAISVLRALVCSKKGPSTVHSILGDFRELEGGPLMYKKFGFPNADEFLKATGEFIVQSRNGETIVYVKPSKESAHILKMVAAQKSTKTKKSGFSTLRQPQKKLGGNNWNPSVYNKMYSQIPQQPVRYQQKGYPPQPYGQLPQRNYSMRNNVPPVAAQNAKWTANNRNLHNIQNNNTQPKPLMSLKISPPSQHNSQSTNQNNQRVVRSEPNNNNSTAKNLNKSAQSPPKSAQSPLVSNDLRHKINDKTPQQHRQSSSLDLKNRLNQQEQQQYVQHIEPHNQKDGLIGDPGANNQPFVSPIPTRTVNTRLQVSRDVTVSSPVVNTYIETAKVSPPQFASNGVQKSIPPQMVIRPTVLNPPIVPVAPVLPSLPGRKSLQDRLKINQQIDNTDLEKVSKIIAPLSPTPKSPDSEKKPSQPLPLTGNNTSRSKEPFSWNQPLVTPVEMLFLYAQHNGFERPIYKYYKLKNKRYQCRVSVNGSTYSTYPDDFANEFEGQFAAALSAIENIKRDEERNNFSVCLDSDYEIAMKIFDLLANCPHGMFLRNIPEAFRNAHKALLPDHWELIIMSHARMFLKEEAQGNTIVFANTQEIENSGSSITSITSEAKCMSVNLLALPWKEQYWSLYVTNPVSTVEIWARLVGPQYSDLMDTLITDIELSMMDNADKLKPKSIAVGEYYLVSTTDCWYRVRAEEIDFENNSCECFFIDIGEWEKVALDEIYVCDTKYLELPAQSICFSLDGLEDFGENPKTKPHLDNLISGKVCIGEILTTKEEFEKDSENSYGDVRIRMILYDTSSDEDVNLNSIILKHVCDDTPVPELNRKTVNTVTITHVDDVGDVYCQLKDVATTYIQKLINNLVQSNVLDGKYRGLYKSKTTTFQQLYLVQDEVDKKWHRASLDAEESGPFCRMLYVDVGIKKRMNVSNIYRLETLSVALCRYPAQAIRMKMFDIPDTDSNEYLLGRLKALLKPGLTAMARVVAGSTVPLVKIYMHLKQNNILVCVNDSIRSELELDISSELISDPRIPANDSIADSSQRSLDSSSFSSKQNMNYSSDYSLASQEMGDLSKQFSSITLQQRNFGSPIPSQVTPNLAKYPLPAVGELFDVLVTIASNPFYFIVQPYTEALKLNRMMIELQEYCMSKAQMVPKDNIQQGEVYAGLNSDGHWYRVLVVNVLCGPALIHVYFCDFGQVQIVDSESLRILPQHLRKLPQQAVKAKLHGVQPLKGDWSTEDALAFKKLIENKKFASYIRSIQVDEFNHNEDFVELTLIDVSTDEDINIHQILVDENRAVLTSK